MKGDFSRKKDFWAGIMLIGIGSGAMVICGNYRFGTPTNMGPGFFPTILGGILTVFGICIMVVGLLSEEKIQGNLSLRVLIMLPLSFVLFGILIPLTGFIPAIVALVFMSAASGRKFKLIEVLLLATVLTVATVSLFIWGLGLPYQLIKGY